MYVVVEALVRIALALLGEAGSERIEDALGLGDFVEQQQTPAEPVVSLALLLVQ